MELSNLQKIFHPNNTNYVQFFRPPEEMEKAGITARFFVMLPSWASPEGR